MAKPEDQWDQRGGETEIPERYGEPVATDWRKISRLTLWGLLILAAITFVFSNQDPVQVRFLTIGLDTTLFWALVATLVLGALIGGGGVLWWQRRRHRREARRAE